MNMTFEEAEQLANDVQSFVSCSPALMNDPDALSILKMRLSAMLFFIGESYSEKQVEVNKLWLQQKKFNPKMTNEEATRRVETTEEYLLQKKLKYKWRAVDRLVTSIRDRLGVLDTERRQSRDV